jgi:hypothetical protein
MRNLPSAAARHQRAHSAQRATGRARLAPRNGDGALQHTKSAQIEIEKASTAPGSPVRTDLDRFVRSSIMRATLGRSPLSLLNACTDWLGHVAVAPGFQQHLLGLTIDRSMQLWQYAVNCAARGATPKEPCITPLPQDKRFSDPAWSTWPFNVTHARGCGYGSHSLN